MAQAFGVLVVGLCLALSAVVQAAAVPATQPGRPGAAASATTTTTPATMVASAPAVRLGPDVVILDQLMSQYEPVPFAHRSHAQMAEMWGGCTTCHHRSPEAATRPTTGAVGATLPPSTQPVTAHLPTAVPLATMPLAADGLPHPTTRLAAGDRRQEVAAIVPTCRSCHDPAAQSEDIHMPNLKGAYHRQCLNCHREWMHGNACVICHKPRDGRAVAQTQPSIDDIVGRMHPPIPEPKVKVYRTRFTPAVGPNAIFRHQEHTTSYGLKCVYCHHRDNCSHCHAPGGADAAGDQKPLHPGRTWRESHDPCSSCHGQDRCRTCHYKDGDAPPASFEHASTGQVLDKDHAQLTCGQCHLNLKTADARQILTCGDAQCHHEKVVAYPAQRPGPVVAATQPSTHPATQPAKVHVIGDVKQVRWQ